MRSSYLLRFSLAGVTLLSAGCDSATLSRGEARKVAQIQYDIVAVSVQNWRYEREAPGTCADYQAHVQQNPQQYPLLSALIDRKLLKLEDSVVDGTAGCYSKPTDLALDPARWMDNVIIVATRDGIVIPASRLRVDDVIGVSQASGAVTAVAQLRIVSEPSWLGKALGVKTSQPIVAEREFRKFDDGWRLMPDLEAEARARLDAARQHSLNVF